MATLHERATAAFQVDREKARRRVELQHAEQRASWHERMQTALRPLGIEPGQVPTPEYQVPSPWYWWVEVEGLYFGLCHGDGVALLQCCGCGRMSEVGRMKEASLVELGRVLQDLVEHPKEPVQCWMCWSEQNADIDGGEEAPGA